MPLFMDFHRIMGATASDVAKAHSADLCAQHKLGVNCIKYWFNENDGKIFCLIDAPSAEAANQVHQDAHGLLAEKIIEVDPMLAEEFLGGGGLNLAGAVLVPGGSENDRDSAIRTVLFTDIVGSTALTQRLGDDAGMAALQFHDGIVREALSKSGGREIKHTGDGIMASFLSAAGAARCSVNVQRALRERDGEAKEFQIKVRIGAAAGEPVEHNQDLFGTTVQLASRLCAHAQPEQILVSNVVAELCVGKGLQFHDIGDVTFKGFDRPLRVQSVAW